MSIENPKCKDCIFGKISLVSSFELPLSPFPSTILVPPKITRECLGRREALTDSLAEVINDHTNLRVLPNRIRRVVPFHDQCAKPSSFSPKTK